MGVKARGTKRNFTSGVWSPYLDSRYDLEKYSSACGILQNFQVQLHGGARYRSGFQYLEPALGFAVLIPWRFNTDPEDIYTLVFTDLKLRFIQGDGYVLSGGSPYEITTTYTEADLLSLARRKPAQVADVMYIAHPNYPLRKLVRSSHTSWAISDVTFASTAIAPASPTATWSGAAGGTITQNYKITSENADGDESTPTSIFGAANSYAYSEWVVGDVINLSWTTEATATKYYIYKELAGYYGLIGEAAAGVTSFRDENYTPDTVQTPPQGRDPFSGGNNPSVVAIYQQRLYCGGMTDLPSSFSAGAVGGVYENFDQSTPILDSDSFDFPLDSGNVDEIVWMVNFSDLLIGTASTEWKVTGDGEAFVSALSIAAKADGHSGSSDLAPLVIGNSVVHAQRQTGQVEDLQYSLEKDGYNGSDLSVLASHLFEGYTLESWAYQQAPDSVVWAVRSDGKILSMTYMKEHQLWGWAVHETVGKFISVSVSPGTYQDDLSAVVEREINGSTVYYVEKLAPHWYESDGIENAFYVDSGLMYDGWNTVSSTTMTLTGSSWSKGEYVTMSSSVALFTSGSVGDRFRLRSGDDQLNVQVLTYVSTSQVTVKLLGDCPASLQATAISDYATLIITVTGLDHLIGESISALYDGSGKTGFTVNSSGEITLPFHCAKVIAGEGYTGILSPLPFEMDTQQGTTQGQPRQFTKIQVRVQESLSGKAGSGRSRSDISEVTLDPLLNDQDYYGIQGNAVSKAKTVLSTGGEDDELTVFVVQDLPLPLNIQSITTDVLFGGDD